MSLLTTTGGVFIGNNATRAAWTDEITTLAEASQIEHRKLGSDEMSCMFPAFRLSGDEPVVYEPNAGVLRPELCIDSQLGLARRSGAELHSYEAVLQIEPKADGVVISTVRSQYLAEQVVVTTGARMNSFMPPEIAEHVKPYRQVFYWFDLAEGAIDYLRPGKSPCSFGKSALVVIKCFMGSQPWTGRLAD